MTLFEFIDQHMWFTVFMTFLILIFLEGVISNILDFCRGK